MASEKKLWSSFAGYRKFLAKALKACNAPESFVSEVGNTGYEGEVATQLFSQFECAESYLNDMKKPKYSHLEPISFWEDAVGCTVHDAVISAVYEYQNAWNYAPGHRIEKIPDVKKLASDVEDYCMKKVEELFAS